MRSESFMVAVSIIIVSLVGGIIILNSKSPKVINQSNIASPVPTLSPTITLPPPPSKKSIENQQIVFSLVEQNNSSQSGTVNIKEVEGKAVVTLEITPPGNNESQPSHIHEGKCPRPGAVKYPLSSVIDGKSITLLQVSLEQFMKELPLAVNVHKSPAELSNYVVCGDIPF